MKQTYCCCYFHIHCCGSDEVMPQNLKIIFCKFNRITQYLWVLKELGIYWQGTLKITNFRTRYDILQMHLLLDACHDSANVPDLIFYCAFHNGTVKMKFIALNCFCSLWPWMTFARHIFSINAYCSKQNWCDWSMR